MKRRRVKPAPKSVFDLGLRPLGSLIPPETEISLHREPRLKQQIVTNGVRLNVAHKMCLAGKQDREETRSMETLTEVPDDTTVQKMSTATDRDLDPS